MNDNLIAVGGGGGGRPEHTTRRRLLNRGLCQIREQGKRLDANGSNLREFPPKSEQVTFENFSTPAQLHIASFPSARSTGPCFLLFGSRSSHISRLEIRAASVGRRFALFLNEPIRFNPRQFVPTCPEDLRGSRQSFPLQIPMNRTKSSLIQVNPAITNRRRCPGNARRSNQAVSCLWLLFVRRGRRCGHSVGHSPPKSE